MRTVCLPWALHLDIAGAVPLKAPIPNAPTPGARPARDAHPRLLVPLRVRMSVLSNPARRAFRTKLLIGAGAAALTLGVGFAGPAAAVGPLPVAVNPGNWSGASASTTGATETVTVTSNRAYAEWSTFNLGSGNTLDVSGQTHPNWILVNKVTNSVTGSTIAGNINAAGQVWIIDPNGGDRERGREPERRRPAAVDRQLGIYGPEQFPGRGHVLELHRPGQPGRDERDRDRLGRRPSSPCWPPA